MSYGREELHQLLTNPAITAMLTNGADSVWYDYVVPDTGKNDSVINYYRVAGVDLSLSYLQTSYSVNCRAADMATAEEIAKAVKNVLSRRYNKAVYFSATLLPVLPPADVTDGYNAPIDVIVRGRNL